MGNYSKSSKSVVSYFGPNTLFEGDFHTDGTVHVDGKFKGSIFCNGEVIVGESSKIEGAIKAKIVVISGHVIGDIEAMDKFEIMPTGIVEGDIKGSKLSIHEGGIYKGQVNMDVIEAQSIYEGLFQVVR